MKKFLNARSAVMAFTVVVGCAGAFAQTPTITVDYASFGDEVLSQVSTMLTAILPVAAVLFGVLKGLSWLRGML